MPSRTSAQKKKERPETLFLIIPQVDYLAAASSLSISVVETILTLPLPIRILGYTNTRMVMITVPIAWVMVRLRSEKAEVIREVTIEIASKALNRPIEH